MTVRIGLLLLMVAPVRTSSAGEPVGPASPERIQRAIEKGLFFIEHRSMLWWRNRGCTTCHEGQMLVVASNIAADRGITVDRETLDFCTERWVLTYSLATNADNEKVNGLGLFSGVYLLQHRDRERDRSPERAAMWKGVLENLFATQQRDDWSWSKTDDHITPLMALALADLESSEIPFPDEFRAEITRRRELTEKAIRTAEPRMLDKTESLCGWLVYEHLRGEEARARALLEELLSRRRDDGGWGITRDDPTHLLVTAVALYSLKRCGLPNDDAVVAETQRLLLDRQSKDGHWRDLGRHFHPEAYHSAYDVWTTGFAVSALSLTLPKLGPDALRLFTPDPELVATVNELRRVAAEGYDGTHNRPPHPTEPDEEIVPKGEEEAASEP